MNISNYYWYFTSAIPHKICDDIIKYSNVGINYINKYEIIDKYYDYMFHKFIYKSIEVYRNIEIILKSEERKEYCLIEIHQIALKYKYYNLNYLETCVLLLKSNRVDIKSSFYNKVFRIISIIKSVLKI